MGPALEQSRLTRALESPQAGLAPWIVMALLEDAVRVQIAAGAALGVALLVVVLGRLDGVSPKLLELADVAFFGALTVVVAVAGDELGETLESWAGEISAGALTAIGIGSMLAGRPFTIQYARERVERRRWGSAAFLGANYAITSVWTAAFALTAIGGLLGHVLVGSHGSFWTTWTVQAGTLIVALRFGAWYPDVVRARVAGPPAQPPSVASLLLPLCPYVTVLGVLTLALDTAPATVGVALLVLAATLTAVLSRRVAVTSR